MSGNVREKALNILSHRDKTEYEMRTSLGKWGAAPEDIDDAVAYLKTLGYIDDESYSCRFVEMSMDKRRGPFRMRRDLREKGVNGDIIDDVMYELLDDEWEWQTAKSVADDIKYKNSNLKPDKLLAKIMNKLNYEGFTNSVVSEIAEEFYESEDI